MKYLFACHWLKQGDRAKHRQLLEEALAVNPADVEVLIALYRIPDAAPEFRQRYPPADPRTARTLHGAMNFGFRGYRDDDRNEPVRLAHRQYRRRFRRGAALLPPSIETAWKEGVNPAGLYDTLARVYYAKGDYDNAVKYQAKALELEPHSGLIAKQLALFRNARDNKTRKSERGKETRKSERGTLK